MTEEIKDWLLSIISSSWKPCVSGNFAEKFLDGEAGPWRDFEEMLGEISATFGLRPDLKEVKKFIAKVFASLPAAPTILKAPEIELNPNIPATPDMIAWGAYKNMLLEEAGFSKESVIETEQSAAWIVSHLNLGDNENDVTSRRGLVMGSVQSGKTANMGAVMSMAADCGINVIIVFSGMYNSLREQTAGRFGEELQSTASVQWEILDLNANPNALSQLDLRPDSPKRYVIVVLKNPHRMTKLLSNIERLRNQKKQMKVLILDDEADQAGINTLKVDSGRRTNINGKLVALTFNLLRGRRQPSPVPFGAMNYLAYTATL